MIGSKAAKVLREVASQFKRGEPISENYFKNLHYWEALTKRKGGLVLYSGKVSNIRQQNFIVENWIKVKNL